LKDWLIVSCFIVVVLAVGWFIFQDLNSPKFNLADSDSPIDISGEPLQIASPDTLIPFIEHAGCRYVIKPQARYRISGILVSKRHYMRGFMSYLSPWDYAIIWGEAPNYLSYMKFDQIVRYCMFEFKSPVQVDFKKIANQMGNNHLIPSTPNLRKALGKARKLDRVKVEGFLVNVVGQDRKQRFSYWNTSLEHTDNGGGACEIIYVTRLRINDKVYE